MVWDIGIGQNPHIYIAILEIDTIIIDSYLNGYFEQRFPLNF